MRILLLVVGSLVGLVLLCVFFLFLYSKRPEAGKYADSIEINRPASEVWVWLTEPAMLTQWVSWLVEVREEGAHGVGQKHVWVMDDPNMRERLALDATTLKWEPDRVLQSRVEMKDGFVGISTFTLTEVDGRTRVEQTGDYEYLNPVFAMMEPLIMPEAKKKMRMDLEKLKQLAEAGPPALPDTVASAVDAGADTVAVAAGSH
jgi:uncharacterized protein YndB with AHSA1/START domain